MPFTITNNLDDSAIYIGLKRLPGETDELFSRRIKRFSSIKYGIDTETSVMSIIEQAGLNSNIVALITSLSPYTISVTKEEVILESFPATGSNEYVKIFINYIDNPSSLTLGQKIKDAIDSSSSFNIEVLDSSFYNITRENIFRSKNHFLSQIVIDKKGTILNVESLIKNSIKSNSPYTLKEVNSLQDIKSIGDYYIDIELGYIEIFEEPQTPFILSFTETKDIFPIYKLDINLIPLDTYSKYGLSDKFVKVIDEYLKGKSLGV